MVHEIVVVQDTVKLKFDADIDSTKKTFSIVRNVGRALVKKKLPRKSKEINAINNSNIMTPTRTFT